MIDAGLMRTFAPVCEFLSNYEMITPFFLPIIAGYTEARKSFKKRAGMDFSSTSQTNLNILTILQNRILSEHRSLLKNSIGVSLYWATGFLSPHRTYFIADELYNLVSQTPFEFFSPREDTIIPFFYPSFANITPSFDDEKLPTFVALLESYYYANAQPIEFYYPDEYDSMGEFQLTRDPLTQEVVQIENNSLWKNILFMFGLLPHSKLEKELSEKSLTWDRETFNFIKKYQIKRYQSHCRPLLEQDERNFLQMTISGDCAHEDIEQLVKMFEKLEPHAHVVMTQEWTRDSIHTFALALLRAIHSKRPDLQIEYQDINPIAKLPSELTHYVSQIYTIGYNNPNHQSPQLDHDHGCSIMHMNYNQTELSLDRILSTFQAIVLTEFQEEMLLFSLDRIASGKDLLILLSPSHILETLITFGNVGWKLTILPLKLLFASLGASYLYFSGKNRTIFELHDEPPVYEKNKPTNVRAALKKIDVDVTTAVKKPRP